MPLKGFSHRLIKQWHDDAVADENDVVMTAADGRM